MEWKDKIGSFGQIDVRGIQGNFFQGIKKQAMQLPAGNGLEIIRNFDPRSGQRSAGRCVRAAGLEPGHRLFQL